MTGPWRRLLLASIATAAVTTFAIPACTWVAPDTVGLVGTVVVASALFLAGLDRLIPGSDR